MKKTGPWSGSEVEVLVPVEDCTPQAFLVKFISTQNEELGQLKDVQLPELADIPDYIPPPFTEVSAVQNTHRLPNVFNRLCHFPYLVENLRWKSKSPALCLNLV